MKGKLIGTECAKLKDEKSIISKNVMDKQTDNNFEAYNQYCSGKNAMEYDQMIKVDADKPFDLKICQSAYQKDFDLTLTPLTVLEDRRCPVNTPCTESGSITILFEIRRKGKVETAKISLNDAILYKAGSRPFKG